MSKALKGKKPFLLLPTFLGVGRGEPGQSRHWRSGGCPRPLGKFKGRVTEDKVGNKFWGGDKSHMGIL